MSAVPTVRGPIDTSQLGVTLMHEHIFVLSADIMLNYPEVCGDEDQRVEDAATRLNALAAQGVRTIVDLTVIGQGRFVPRIQRVAQRTSINIIVATGIYTFRDIPFYFRMRGATPPPGGTDVVTEMFVRDITSGHMRRDAVAAALRQYSCGAVVNGPDPLPETPGATDLDQEIAYLLRVAHAYASSPMVRADRTGALVGRRRAEQAVA